ncbi:MAG: dCTP deaminase [Ignisphaera sp.]|nr:dCTP deaminase [Ignisphaera sp.]MCX8168108.1 dCTP deaminase [Ignisphaera sp.]MDW8085457.1 dCTP deaminase [Ignisphaera sp.]
MILSDFDLRNYIRSGRLTIEPFDEITVRENGLDLRLGNEVCELLPTNEVLDPFKEVELSKYYKCWKFDEVVIKPLGIYLLATTEYIKVPPELMAFVELRSTFARLGLSIPPTIIDGGFEGQITIELHGSAFPVSLRANTRFLHVVFSKVVSPIEKPYSGKYQGQRGVRLPKIPLERI